VLLAALAAAARDSGIICPADCGGEAAWAGDVEIIAAPNLLAIINHFNLNSAVAGSFAGPSLLLLNPE
jgi:magnesium chelatase family protein